MKTKNSPANRHHSKELGRLPWGKRRIQFPEQRDETGALKTTVVMCVRFLQLILGLS